MNSVEHPETVANQQIKQCCSQIYASDAARFLLGDSFHPGGLQLTEHLGHLLQLTPASSVLDVAAGKGASALSLAQRFGCSITGIDLSSRNVEEATRTAQEAACADRVHFQVADSETLPFAGGSFDAVLCECAFCTFPNKSRAASEFARVLRSGGRVGLSDLTRGAELPAELTGLLAWIACIADALSTAEYEMHMRSAGLVPETTEAHDSALREMTREIQGRILSAQIVVGLKKIELPGFDFAQAAGMAKAALLAIERGHLGYAVFLARKP